MSSLRTRPFVNESKHERHDLWKKAMQNSYESRQSLSIPKSSKKVRAVRTLWTFLCLTACSYHAFEVTSLYFQWDINAEAFFFPTDPIIPPMITVCLAPQLFKTQCPEPLVNGTCLAFMRTPQQFFDANYRFEELVKSIQIVDFGVENQVREILEASMIKFKEHHVTTYKFFEHICFAIDYMKSFKEKFYRQVDIQAMTMPIVFRIEFNFAPPGLVFVTLGPRGELQSKVTGATVQFAEVDNRTVHFITYRKKQLSLLPSPYATKCRNYAKEGVVGVKTREKCVRNCNLVQSMKDNGGKIRIENPVVQNYSSTNDNRSLETFETKSLSQLDCQRRCVLIECDIDEYVAWASLKEVSTNGEQRTGITLQLPSEADLKVNYKPKMTFWEYSTLFGSVFGLWFGLSVFNCEKLVEKLIAKRKSKRKVISTQ